MLKYFLPKETSFFAFFEQHSTLSIEACKEFNDLATRPDELALRVARIKQIEHRADDVTHKCINALHSTFITPIDRADIHRLIRRLDDIIDSVDSAASRMALYELTSFRPELRQLTEVLVTATAHIDSAVRSLPRLAKESDNIQKCCIAICLPRRPASMRPSVAAHLATQRFRKCSNRFYGRPPKRAKSVLAYS